MPDDQVTLDPEFGPSPRNRRIHWPQLAALAAAALLLGWLLRSPTSGDLVAAETSSSTTASTREATSTTRPSTATTATTATTASTASTETTIFEMVGLAVPLAEAVPGFADTITMALSTEDFFEERVDVVRWRSAQAAPETMLSFRQRPNDRTFVGLDAGGIWYAVHGEDTVLSVHLVAAVAEDADRSAPPPEAVGIRVASSAWHDTEPGRLAWVSCPRAPGGPGTLYTLDVADGSAEAARVASLPDACRESAEAWINRWGDWGFAIQSAGDPVEGGGLAEPGASTVLLDPRGVELARLDHSPGGTDLVAAGPNGTVWTEQGIGATSSSFLLSGDGQRRTPVPGLAEGEWVVDVWWSPDGSRIALVPFSPRVEHPLLRVIDMGTGDTVAEIDERDSVAWHARWSSDGRFLLYGRDRGGGGPSEASLVVYDTASAAIAAEVPMPERHGIWEIRAVDPATVVVRLASAEWGIGLDDAGLGVHTVFMIVDARPLTPDQVEGQSGRLIWDERVVDLCGIEIRVVGAGYVHIGDIFQTTEGCGSHPTAMQDAFDELGLPETACVAVRFGGSDHEYCAPLS